MKIVKVLGGLGNQMFQYALYYALSKQVHDVKLDLSEFKTYTLHNGYEISRIFDLDAPRSSFFENIIYGGTNRDYISRILKKIVGKRRSFYEQNSPCELDISVFSDAQKKYLWGYWQNEKYFESYREDIKNIYKFPEINDALNSSVLKRIESTQSVAIHVRRGDYISHALLGAICDEQYYRKAIAFFRTNFTDPEFFVFSDDIEWCKRHIDVPQVSYISWNKGSESYKDMQLMSKCKSLIIANSSFSWWAAWLNSYEKKVIIAPKKWFNDEDYLCDDIVPESWVRM